MERHSRESNLACGELQYNEVISATVTRSFGVRIA